MQALIPVKLLAPASACADVAPAWRLTPGAARRHRAFGALCLAILALQLSACGANTDKPAMSGVPGAVDVGIVTLKPQALTLQTELPGRVVAAQTAEIRPQVGGLVRERLFTEGSTVRAGQVLYAIDDASYRAALSSAEADVAKSQATLDAARLKAKRVLDLAAADAATQQDAEDAQSTQAQAQAALQAAQAALATARLNLDRTRVTAPIAGRVDTSAVTAGALVTAAQTTALTTVSQTDPIWVDIPQSSAELLKLRRQLSGGTLQSAPLAVRLTLEDGQPYAHPGTLEVKGVSVNASSGAVTLRARVPNPEGLLMPGMFVRATLDQARVDDALLVPQAGVQRNARGEASAWVVGIDNQAQRRAVKVAEVVNGQWRVTGGLAAGDRLIVEGAGKLREGQIVHAVPAGSAAPAERRN